MKRAEPIHRWLSAHHKSIRKDTLKYFGKQYFLTLLLLGVLQEYEMCEASGTSFNFVIEIFILLTRPPVLPSWRWLG